MIIEIAITLGLVICFALLILFGKHFRVTDVNQRVWLYLFILKFFTGAMLVMLYVHYYNPWSADMFKYYRGGEVIYSALDENPSDYFKMLTGIKGDEPQLHVYYDAANYWYKQYDYGLYNDNRSMIRLNALLCVFSGGRFFVHVVIMAFLSFLGSYWLFLALKKITRFSNKSLIFGVFLIPTVLVWSSGLLKEGLLMFSFGALFFTSVKMREKFKWPQILVWILLALLVYLTKFYVLLCIIPSIIFLWVTAKIRLKKPLVLLTPIVLIVLILLATSKYYSPIDFPTLVERKQHDFVKFVNSVDDVGSNIVLPDLEPNFGSLMIHLPNAYFNSFFRPHLGEASLGLQMLAAFENLLFLLLIVLAIAYFKKPDNLTRTFVWAALTFVLFLYGIAGITTPNLGALVRYKMPAMPFLFFALYACIDNKRLPKFIRRLNLFSE
jgi:hypothetical protein